MAFKLPENTLKSLGDQSQNYIFKVTQPSQLAIGQQQLIETQYLNKIAQNHPAKIIFREGNKLGANALALPNNTIIVTDELIALTHSDQEILGILAHEQGHLIQRHSLQQGLSNLGFKLFYLAIVGDQADFLNALPLAVLNASYSQQFEAEADLYALNLMNKQNIEVSHFANFLQRLNDESLESKNQNLSNHSSKAKIVSVQQEFDVFENLVTHPATEQRIQMVREFEKNHSHAND